MNVITLSSMGTALDNVGEQLTPYSPNVTDLFYSSIDKSIYYVKSLAPNQQFLPVNQLLEISSSPGILYKNERTNRYYRWDSNTEDMVETVFPFGETEVVFEKIIECGENIHIGNDKLAEPLSSNKLIVFDGGKYDNYLLTGNNIIIVALNDNIIFNNCEFAGTFCYSALKATNFGCVSGITETSINWEYGAEPHLTTENGVKQYGGTDNTAALNSIAQFCSGSDHVKIEFNGEFFSINANSPNEKVSPIIITSASNLELCGSSQPTLSAMRIKDENGAEIVEANTSNDNNWAMLKRLVTGFKLINCNDVEIHHLSFIGLHSPHAFPPRYGNIKSFNPTTNGNTTLNSEWVKWGLRIGGGDRYYSNNSCVEIEGEGYTSGNTYSYSNDGVVGISIAAVSVSTLENKTSERVNVHDCNFTMRCNGVIFGGYDSHAALKNGSNQYIAQNSSSEMRAVNCRADHIYWQPVGFHCTGGKAKDFYIDYCGQPIDISTFSNNCSVDNVVALRCCYGPKQECNTTRTGIPADICRALSHDNSISNCDIEISDDIYCIDTEAYILHVAQGASNSHFLATDCKFTVYSRKKTFVGVQLENDNVTIRNTEFYVDVQTKWNLVSNVGYCNPVTEAVEYGERYVYQSDNGLLDTDIPKLFYGNRWQGSERTNLALDNVVVNISQNTSIEKAFSDLKNLYACNVKFESWNGGNDETLIAPEVNTTSHLRKIEMYMIKVQSSQLLYCEFYKLKAKYFAHTYVTHMSMIGGKLGNVNSIVFNYQSALNGSSSLTLELIDNEITGVATLIFYNKTSRLFDLYCAGNSISAGCFFQGKLEPDTGGSERTIIDLPPHLHIVNNQINITYTEAFRLEQGFAMLFHMRRAIIVSNAFSSNLAGTRNDLLLPYTNTDEAKELLRSEISHLFWNNTISGTMDPIDTGTIGCRPLYPSEGMLFHAVDNNEVVTHYMCMLNEWVEVVWVDDEWVRVQDVEMD